MLPLRATNVVILRWGHPERSRFSGGVRDLPLNGTRISMSIQFKAVRFAATVIALSCALALAQDAPIPQLRPGSERKPAESALPSSQPAVLQTIPLSVPKGTPVQIALDQEVRLRRVGQPIHARVVEPVYAFDKLVVPAGTEALGKVISVEHLSKGKRTTSALDADFTPARKVQVEFTELVMSDGRHTPIHTTVTPGSGHVLQFTSTPEKKKTLKDAATTKASEAKAQARQEWDSAMAQLKTPGKVHRIERFVESQLPVHAQYIPAGTVYFAELNDALDFGSEVVSADRAATIGGALPPGSVVHARLVTPLNSATARKGDQVEAVLSRPLFDGDRLVLPEGSRLQGSVLQAHPAGRWKKNGQLRMTFRELSLPDGVSEKVQAAIEAVEAAKDGHMKLDSEGGAEATTPKTRYLGTAVSLWLAAASGGGDHDRVGGSGDPGSRAAGGAGGFKLIGIALGLAVRSQAFGRAMGVYGAGMSVYSNFMSRGQEVVFPKNMAMDVAVGQRDAAAPAVVPENSSPGGSSGPS